VLAHPEHDIVDPCPAIPETSPGARRLISQSFGRRFRDPEALNAQYTPRQEVLTMREACLAGVAHPWELGRRAPLEILWRRVCDGRPSPPDPCLGAGRE